MSGYYNDHDGYSQEGTEPDDGIEALRKEVAELRELLSGMDAGEEIAVADQRRLLRERAEREARAVTAADDPATLEALRRIDNPEDLERFFRDNGGA